MTQISAAIITLNEEKNIGRCIESLKGVVDEVVVVDSLSTDRTKAIAEELEAKVIEQSFLGHIEQKNFAIEQTAHNYVISLDADECLSAELRESILKIKSNLTEDGYSMHRLTNYCGAWIRHGGWYPDTKLRLFKKGQGAWTGTNPHDRFELNSKKKGKLLSGDLLHYSFYTIEQHEQQIVKFSDIAAQAKFDQGQRSNVLKLIIKPVARFIKGFILKAGFLDGYYGWVIATKSSYATYLKYKKLLNLQRS